MRAASSRSSSLGLAAILLGLLVASRTANADVAQAAVAGADAARYPDPAYTALRERLAVLDARLVCSSTEGRTEFTLELQ